MKPFDYRKLEARARVLFRRSTGEPTNQLTCGRIAIDRGTRVVTIGGAPVDLTRRELTLLEIMAARPGRIFGRTNSSTSSGSMTIRARTPSSNTLPG